MYRYIFKILLSACIFAGVLIKFNTRNKTVVATLKSVCYNKFHQTIGRMTFYLATLTKLVLHTSPSGYRDGSAEVRFRSTVFTSTKASFKSVCFFLSFSPSWFCMT